MPLNIFISIVTVLITIFLLLILFLINFYKDPGRKIPGGDNIVSPADGKVINILKINTDKISVRKGFLGKIERFGYDRA